MESGKSENQRIRELEVQLGNATYQRERIDILNELAWAGNLVDPEMARSYSEQAYKLSSSGEFEKEPYLPGMAASLRCLAALNNDAGRYDKAVSLSFQALEILDGISNGGMRINMLTLDIFGAISWAYRSYGDYGISAEYAMKALKLAQEMGDLKHEAGFLNVLSVIYAESNDHDAALEMGLKALQHTRKLGHVKGESLALNNLAMTYLEMGNGAQALETCKESLRIARENGLDIVELSVLSTMGEIYLGIKDYASAEDFLSRALNTARRHNASPEEFLCLLNLGKVYRCQANDQGAISAFLDAIAISQASNDRRGEFQCHQALSEMYEKQGQFETALRHFKQFHALKETVHNEKTVKRLTGLQVLHQVENAKRDAETHYQKTIELEREIERQKNTQETLEKLATIDPLTGLFNRREFFALGEREFRNARQDGQSLTAILMDLDHLKQINDLYGHGIGDQALIHVARIMHDSLRQNEIMGRYGGDEFAILLPGNNSMRGQQVAKRLREKVASLSIATSRGPLSLTLSLGIAELQDTYSNSLDILLDLADQALYTAKRAGRNQTAVYNSNIGAQAPSVPSGET